jgi:hypothetical protein
VPNKRILFYLALSWTGIIAFFCLIQANDIPSVNLPILNLDKIVHAFFHFVFTSLWFLFFFKQFNKTASLKLLIVAFIFSVFYGITIEVLQEVITLTRNADVFDVSGALIAFGVCYILKRKKLKFNS